MSARRIDTWSAYMMFEAWDDAAVELEQDAEQDPGSFEDSDRFEEDSICSWLSEAESLCTNWRGWKKCSSGSAQGSSPQPQKFSALSSTAGMWSVSRFIALDRIGEECIPQFYTLRYLVPPRSFSSARYPEIKGGGAKFTVVCDATIRTSHCRQRPGKKFVFILSPNS